MTKLQTFRSLSCILWGVPRNTDHQSDQPVTEPVHQTHDKGLCPQVTLKYPPCPHDDRLVEIVL